jgi:deazaflavin-dependent oxidoreductase (nitroreductase family)
VPEERDGARRPPPPAAHTCFDTAVSLATQLSYTFAPATRLQRIVQALVASRPGAWVFARILPTLDTWVGRLSRGRTSVPALLAGLPVLDVTTTGRRSGRRRTTHLVGIPVGDRLALIGTNFGQPSTPAWALNLEGEPRATVTYRNRSVDVVARPADPEEFDAALRTAAPLYGGYAKYRQRIGDRRRLRIFMLEPSPSHTGGPGPATTRSG